MQVRRSIKSKNESTTTKRTGGMIHGHRDVLDMVAMQEASTSNSVLHNLEACPTRSSGYLSILLWMVNRFVGEEDSV